MFNRSGGVILDCQSLAFNYDRRFGVEIEVNALDGRDFVKHPLHSGELPLGIDYIGDLLRENTRKPVIINKWHYTHNNDGWVLKPDSSCGIELCSPVSKRWQGLKEICRVIDLLRVTPDIMADHRCSLHVHVEVADLDLVQLNKVLTYWVKCEPVFLDSVPLDRKLNRYCQSIGETELFNVQQGYDDVWQRLGSNKYLTANTYHYVKGRRRTVEFRIIGNEGCKNPYLVKNWVRLLVHFVEMVKNLPSPGRFRSNDPWSSFCWLDVVDVFQLLGFDGRFELSKGLEQTRAWFLANLYTNLSCDFEGVWGPRGRAVSKRQVDELVDKLGLDVGKHLSPSDSETLYSETYRA